MSSTQLNNIREEVLEEAREGAPWTQDGLLMQMRLNDVFDSIASVLAQVSQQAREEGEKAGYAECARNHLEAVKAHARDSVILEILDELEKKADAENSTLQPGMWYSMGLIKLLNAKFTPHEQ